MKKSLLFTALAVIAIIVLIAVFYKSPAPAPSSANARTYTSVKYGFSFSYPDDYVVGETTTTAGYEITLARKEDLPPPANSEPAPMITVDIYPNPTTLPLADWLSAHNNFSNYGATDTATSAALVANSIPAIGYLWQGLYQGFSMAFAKDTNVIIFTGTYNSPSDQILKDFEGVIASIKIQQIK